MKKIIIALIILVMMFCISPFKASANNGVISSNGLSSASQNVSVNDIQYPIIINKTVKTISFHELISGLAKTKGMSPSAAAKYILSKEKEFEKRNPELFASYSTSTSGHYEYVLYSRDMQFGYVYWQTNPFGGEDSGPLVIRQAVYAEVYVYGSFRQFAWVGDPFTEADSNGGYTWHPAYNHTRLDSAIQFTALSSGYSEVAISSSFSGTIGAQLEGAGFSFSYSSGSTYYYRKNCDFPTWTVKLYND